MKNYIIVNNTKKGKEFLSDVLIHNGIQDIETWSNKEEDAMVFDSLEDINFVLKHLSKKAEYKQF